MDLNVELNDKLNPSPMSLIDAESMILLNETSSIGSIEDMGGTRGATKKKGKARKKKEPKKKKEKPPKVKKEKIEREDKPREVPWVYKVVPKKYVKDIPVENMAVYV